MTQSVVVSYSSIAGFEVSLTILERIGSPVVSSTPVCSQLKCVYVLSSSSVLSPRLKRSLVVGNSHLRFGILQSPSGSNMFLLAPNLR